MKYNKLIVVGSGGHASVVLDAAKLMSKWQNIFILDQHEKGIVIKVDDDYSNRHHYRETCEVIVAIGDNQYREKVMNEMMNEGFSLATIVHPSAIIAESASIEEGSCILAGVVLNPYVTIGKGVIVNTSSSLDHHNQIGEYSHVCPGSVLAGNVIVGRCCFLGTGSVVSNRIQISDHVTLGAGCVVVKSITAPGTYVGIPARKI